MGSIGGGELPIVEKMQMAGTREEKILVLVRLRPLSEKEINLNEPMDWECINDTTILYRNTLREGSTFPSAYSFDRVFRGDCLNREVYEAGAKEVALSVVNGINSSIFAYGQTSSGKTYTMVGITEYAVADIFDYVHRHEERAFVLKFSAIEIYNEAIRDLLTTDGTSLRLLDDIEKGTIVEKVKEETLKDWNHLQELLSVCEAQRRIGETSLNEKSSRSHQILRLTIESSAREFLGKENSTSLSATVNFVDLAGSERASQALSSGTRLKEGCHINRSLLTLGTVIRKLSKGRQGHINFRDSKLTRLLQPALGGNARTAIICTLSPGRSHVEQTRNTLLFACCAKEVTTKAQVNVVMSDKALVKQLQKELARLESELRSPVPVSSNGDYAALLKKKDLQIQKMEKEMRELTKQRDLAESRVQDLLRIIADDQNSRKEGVTNYLPNRQVRNSWEDECSISESSGLEDPYSRDQGVGSTGTRYTRNGEICSEEPYWANNKEHSVYDGTSSLISIGRFGTTDDANDYCKEVQCIETEDARRENNFESSPISNGQDEERLALTANGNGYADEEEISTPAHGERGIVRVPDGSTNDVEEQRPHHAQRTVDDLISPNADEPSPWSSVADLSNTRSNGLARSWSCRENRLEDSESTPPDGVEKRFAGRPEGFQRKFPPLNYYGDSGRLSRNGSQSSLGSADTDDSRTQGMKASADEDIPSIQTFVAGLKEMAKQEYEKQLVEGQDTGMVAFPRAVKDVGLNPMHEASENTSDWDVEFETKQRAILELWQACNVPFVHRTYFFLLFKGDRTDSVYLEVEYRRLSFLKETFSHGSQSVGGDQTLTLASSKKALNRERLMLSKLMQKRFSSGERRRLYEKWGIALNSKRRRLQLANRLWSSSEDKNHVIESAAIVAKLVMFVEQGKALKGMFGLSFTPPGSSSSGRRRSLAWSYSRSTLP